MSQGGLTSANLWTGGSTVVKKHSHTFPAPTNSHARTHMLILADAHARTWQKERHCKLTCLMICARTHVARGDFSITASAKQSPERDVPCLSGKAFQPRFFFFSNLFLSQLLDSCQVHNQKWHSTKQQTFPQWNFTGNDGRKLVLKKLNLQQLLNV